MKIVRYLNQEKVPQYGWVFEDRIGIIHGDPFSNFTRQEASIPLSSVELLAPCQPSKIIAFGNNFADPTQKQERPGYPLIFLKPPSALIATGKPILLPPQSRQVEHEAELAVVIRKRSRWLNENMVRQAIFGYTLANDVTARDLQINDMHLTRSKAFDSFCPLGPWIETEFSPSDAMISCQVNGFLRQMASTHDMLFSVDQLILYASSMMTLEPGDVILTGTPAGAGPLVDGDQVLIHIAGIGSLSNPVQRLK